MFPFLGFIARTVRQYFENGPECPPPVQPTRQENSGPTGASETSTYQRSTHSPHPTASNPSVGRSWSQRLFSPAAWQESLIEMAPANDCERQELLEDFVFATAFGAAIGPIQGPLAYTSVRPWIRSALHYFGGEAFAPRRCDPETVAEAVGESDFRKILNTDYCKAPDAVVETFSAADPICRAEDSFASVCR